MNPETMQTVDEPKRPATVKMPANIGTSLLEITKSLIYSCRQGPEDVAALLRLRSASCALQELFQQSVQPLSFSRAILKS